MQINKYNIKLLVVILFSLVFFEFLFAQKTLDHTQFIEKIKHSSDNIYKEFIKEYDTYLEEFPNDISVLIEKCKFIQYAQYDENEYFNPNQAEFDRCSSDIINRFPAHPEVLLFQTTFLWGEDMKEVFENAEKSIEDNPEKWNNTNLAAMYETMANYYYYYETDYKQAIFYMEKAISNDEKYKHSLEYARILLGLEMNNEAISVLIAIPDTIKDIWQLVQKADLFLDLKDYANALSIYNQVEQMDSTYINNAVFASTFEGLGQYELARKYLVADISNIYDKKGAHIRLLNHDIKYQDGSKSIASYNAFRDLGYSSDPVSLHRLKLFFSYPTQPWKLRDLFGILSLLALLAILIVIPYIWILPIYFAGKRFKFLFPKKTFESNWTLKMFWFVSIGYLFASLFACIIEPEALYSTFNDSYYAGISTENLGFEVLVFSIIMAMFGLMAMYKVNPKILLSSSNSIGKSILMGVGIFFLFKLISGLYILFGTTVFDISIDDIAIFPKKLLATREEIDAVISTFGKSSSILLLGFLVPIYEEIIFRGVVLEACQRHINFKSANIFQALLFAALHDSLFLFPLFFLFGIFAGIARKKLGGLLPCLVFHILNNVIVIYFF